ncbi:MAG: SxtJ family membrane protein [Thermodesulfobacteriota bacterium]|nr:SxtJ family membrane protein [Thermodesulfobacteriota bacterium]
MKTKITPKQCTDSGLALILIALLLAYFGKFSWAVPLGIVLALITMVWPAIFKPFAVVWFGFSHLLGTIMSRVLLTLLFFLVVTPIGLVRRMFGADPLRLRQWKKGSGSVFQVRDKTFDSKSLDQPY